MTVTSRLRNGRHGSYPGLAGAGGSLAWLLSGPPGIWAMCSSSTDRARLASTGERIPPCGTPAVLSRSAPSWPKMPAFTNALTRARTRLFAIHNLMGARRDVTLDDPLIGENRQIAGLGDRVMSATSGMETVVHGRKSASRIASHTSVKNA
jgi:hypothetical protein